MAEYAKIETAMVIICDLCGSLYPDGYSQEKCGLGKCDWMEYLKETAADVAPVVHGCFEPCFDENGNWRQGFAKCSNCGKEYYAQVINHFGYCPNCGAKMDGGADNA